MVSFLLLKYASTPLFPNFPPDLFIASSVLSVRTPKITGISMFKFKSFNPIETYYIHNENDLFHLNHRS